MAETQATFDRLFNMGAYVAKDALQAFPSEDGNSGKISRMSSASRNSFGRFSQEKRHSSEVPNSQYQEISPEFHTVTGLC